MAHVFRSGLLLVCLWLTGCSTPAVTQNIITVTIRADQKDYAVKISAGSTTREALGAASLSLGVLDRVDPLLYTVLKNGDQVKVVRVREEYYQKREVIPFEHKELRNEALPHGEQRITQPGINGVQELTYHRHYEDGVLVSDSVVKTTVLQEAKPEIIMVGSQSNFTSLSIMGKIAYISGGNAWIIEGTTTNHQLIVSSADLDGRIFTLSKNGNYLLFTRADHADQQVNSLWLAALNANPIRLFDLGVRNVVHFADFNPDGTKVVYSTAEWKEISPGWQANNDLWGMDIPTNDTLQPAKQYLNANSGGLYGWWGITFLWSGIDDRLIYSRPDGVGLIDLANKQSISMLSLNPYVTGGDWAWSPGIACSPDGSIIYTVNYTSGGSAGTDQKGSFDLIAIPMSGRPPVTLVRDVGMFAYPAISPQVGIEHFLFSSPGQNLEQASYSIAYLQSLNPGSSQNSEYQLFSMDRDGSNNEKLFPLDGSQGLEPQHVVWSPQPLENWGDYGIALIYNGNIWLVDNLSGAAQQITGDGLASHIDWR